MWITVRFEKDSCQVLDEGKLVAVADKIEELYYVSKLSYMACQL